MAKITSKMRRGELQKAFLRAVMGAGEKGIHFDDAMTEIEKSVELTDYEKSTNSSGNIRWRVFMAFGVIGFYKFGYAIREKNVFWITDEGRRMAEMSHADLRSELKKRWDEREEADTGDNVEEVNLSNDISDAGVYLEAPSYLQNERTVFKRVDYDLAGLLHYIDIGDIGLPDIQRPFVWSSSDVRDLFDSMYRGFPVGYLLFWSNSGIEGTRFVGTVEKSRKIPHLLIVDGQQRLTSLYAVMCGKKVVDDNYKEKQIEIAFRPRDGRFEVCDAAIRRDPEFVPNISDLWASKKSSWTLVNEFLKKLEIKRSLDEKQKETISHNLDRLFDLQKYPFTALEISSAVEEEQAADIFVRINSKGEKLNQGDFILTLLSVFWEEGRKEIEMFCRNSRIPTQGTRPSPFNHFISPDPDNLLRVEVAIGFYRGRLKTVYQLLRGKDLETGQVSEEKRDQQFMILAEAQKVVLDLSNWHGFFSCLIGAGFRSRELVSSDICLIYCYAMYLIGRTKFLLSDEELQRVIGRFFFAASISNRYVGSFESTIESDLNRIKDLTAKADFMAVLEKIVADTMTGDFWNITLPNELNSSSARNPAFYSYLAAQNKLGVMVLFSKNRKIFDMLDPTVRSNRKALEKHHLFPRAWLEEEGISDLKLINQVANFALIDWGKNGDISDTAPREYVPEIKKQFEAEAWSKMCGFHALPEGWEKMPYDEFLVQRRNLMAQIIKQGFESIH